MSTAQATRLTAILTMVAAMACLSTQDTFSKKLMLSLAPIIIWATYALQTGLARATIWRRHSPELWRTRQWRLQLLRGALVVSCSLFGFDALQRMPVAEFTAIYGVALLAVTVVVRFVMKDHVYLVCTQPSFFCAGRLEDV